MAYDLPSCDECKKWVYEGHKTGRAIKKTANSGRTFERLPMMPTPCHECPKLTMEHRRFGHTAIPANATEATDRQYQALNYYRMVKFDRAGTLPYDSLTLQNNVLIAQAEEDAKEVRKAYQPIVIRGA